MALLMVVAANTSLTVAVTDIQQKLHAMTSQTRWILDAYPLTVASLLLLFGAAGDRYGRRLALNLGLVGFGAASVFAALSTTPGEVIAARALMGVSGALIMPATLAFVRVLFPPSERMKAVTIWSASSGVAVTVGPLAARGVDRSARLAGRLLAERPARSHALDSQRVYDSCLPQ